MLNASTLGVTIIDTDGDADSYSAQGFSLFYTTGSVGNGFILHFQIKSNTVVQLFIASSAGTIKARAKFGANTYTAWKSVALT